MKSVKNRFENMSFRAIKAGILIFVILTFLFVFTFSNDQVLAHTPSPPICDDLTCNVDLRDNVFQPASLSIKAPNSTTGESVTVVFQNHGLFTHTVTSGVRGSPDGIFDQTLAPGAVFQFTVNQSVYSQILSKYPNGVLSYHCGIHFGMDATLTIRAATTQTPTLSVTVSANPSQIQSEQTSTITVYVISGGNPISGVTVTLSSGNVGTLAQTSGTTDSGGYFTTTFTAPTVATQASVTITASATKTGYQNGQNQATLTINPASTPPPEGQQPNTNLWIYLAIVAIVVVVLSAAGLRMIMAKRKTQPLK